MFFEIRNVFLGEIFSAIVSLHNQSDQILRDVILKVNFSNKKKKTSIYFIFILDRYSNSYTTYYT